MRRLSGADRPGRVRCAAAVLSMLLTALPGAAEQLRDVSARRTMTAVRLQPEESISLDGRLDEEMWQRAEPATDFLQQDPSTGAPATERTEVRVLLGRHNLYLGVTCYDSEPNRVLGNQLQRDQSLEADDRFMWTIDTYLDGRTGYFFEINPSGAMGDGVLAGGAAASGDSALNKQWDGIWTARVRRTSEGWTAEIQLPFRTLNFEREGRTWGINFQRTIRRRNEETLWSGHARNQGLFRMAHAGLLNGLTGLDHGIGLDLKPYLVGTFTSAPGRGAPASVGDAEIGLDAIYNITPALRGNLSLNTDFAETEVDQRRVNLTRFPLFFPEKREFFLEGLGFFDFSREPGNAVVPFFSRRIGIDPDGNPQHVDVGVKMTGQAGRQDIGVLQVRTGRQGDAPGEDFTVARVKRRFLTQGYAGFIYTRRSARGVGTEPLHTAGLDFAMATSQFRGSQNLELSAFWLWNTNPLGTGQNHAYGARLNYPNDLWNARISFRELQDHHDPAVGFTERAGYRRLNPVARFSPRPSRHPYLRRLSFEVHLDLMADMANDPLTRKWDLTVLEIDFHSGDKVEAHVIRDYERLDRPFRVADTIILPVGSSHDFTRYRVSAETAGRRMASATALFEAGRFFSGERREIAVGLVLRPRAGLLGSLEVERNRLDFGAAHLQTRLYRALLNTQFSPWISLGNTVQYDSVSRLLGWQMRFRWIPRAGNDLYLVYTHNWRDDPLEHWQTLDRRAAAKVIYTHRF
ncbi:MAG TPA: DUF5916 domain-containing protein [Vicinamibacterales bacterium]|nr:DUF5916 domain-containing protein [Vicinamibacterales bacterium]